MGQDARPTTRCAYLQAKGPCGFRARIETNPDGESNVYRGNRDGLVNRSAIHSPRQDGTAWALLFACWLLASIATLGSLFFSEVMGLPPCVLCWWQRVFMYPLVVIFLVGLFSFDRTVVRYALPLAALGWLTAFYHYLVYSGYIPEGLQPCGQGPSCARINLELFGFVTIPLLSLAAFSVIIVLLFIIRRRIS